MRDAEQRTEETNHKRLAGLVGHGLLRYGAVSGPLWRGAVTLAAGVIGQERAWRVTVVTALRIVIRSDLWSLVSLPRFFTSTRLLLFLSLFFSTLLLLLLAPTLLSVQLLRLAIYFYISLPLPPPYYFYTTSTSILLPLLSRDLIAKPQPATRTGHC